MDIACFVLPHFILHSFKKGGKSQLYPWKEGRAVPGELVNVHKGRYLDGRVCYMQSSGETETLKKSTAMSQRQLIIF